MVVDYDSNENLTYTQRLQSLRDSVQRAFDESSADLENTNGDVMRIRKMANGLTVNIANAEGEISALQLRAGALESFVGDANSGNLTTVMQTASSLQTEVTNGRGSYSNLKARFDAITTTVSNKADSTTLTQTANALTLLINNETDARSALIRATTDGVLVAKKNQTYGALVNANGSFDVATLSWSGDSPSVTGTRAKFGSTIQLYDSNGLVRLTANNTSVVLGTLTVSNGMYSVVNDTGFYVRVRNAAGTGIGRTPCEVTADGLTLRNSSNSTIATFGSSSITLGLSDNKNVSIDTTNGLCINNGSITAGSLYAYKGGETITSTNKGIYVESKVDSNDLARVELAGASGSHSNIALAVYSNGTRREVFFDDTNFSVPCNTSINGTLNATGTIKSGSVELTKRTDIKGMFSTSGKNIVEGASLAELGQSGSYNTFTSTFTKSGYYPFAIAWIDTSGTNAVHTAICKYKLSNRASGRCDISVTVKNTASATATITIAVYVLWVQET